MKIWAKIISGITFIIASSSANAVVIDFNLMAEPTGSHGESAWDSLNLSFSGFDLSATGTQNGNAAYAYLDSNNGGLGVCGKVYHINKANKITNSSSNLCNKGSDDNITNLESLSLVFSSDVVIDTIWFNNNHDGDHSLYGDKINIDGAEYTFFNGAEYVDSFTTTPYAVNAGESFDIAFNNEEFYLDALEVNVVPAPAPLFLMLFGLLVLLKSTRKTRV